MHFGGGGVVHVFEPLMRPALFPQGPVHHDGQLPLALIKTLGEKLFEILNEKVGEGTKVGWDG